MARQPIPKQYHDAPKTLGTKAPAGSRLASLIGQCAANSAESEVHMGLCLGSMLGVENAASVAVFTSIQNSRARREIVFAAAEASLGEDDLNVLRIIIDIYNRLDGVRTDIVHGIWGSISTVPDQVVWTSVKQYSNFLINDYKMSEKGDLTYEWRQEQWLKICSLWKLDEIELLIKQMDLLADLLRNFHAYLRYRQDPAGKSAYEAILTNPLYVDMLREKS
ncbi:hypothetical protein [Oceaniglobus roseus]|uniref:hypothetical protein n=1 Tax=Oceaniglobus roseus TaxID=1737570 RepID=UPI0015626925|nr:hypothetical protein [Kandeliimicrobium roseum]